MRSAQDGKEAAQGLILGPIVLVIGLLCTLSGLVFIGIPLVGLGGALILGGGIFVGQKGVEVADRVKHTPAGRAVQARYQEASTSITAAAQENQAKARARRVIAQLREQLEAGAIDESEFSDRVRRVNEKLAQELNREEGRING